MPPTSIHHQRRGFYVLWVALLLVSAMALFLWERPVRTELASLQVKVRVTGAPEGTRILAWAGPSRSYAGHAWTSAGIFGDLPLAPDGTANLPLVRLHLARRRWNQGWIPRGTWDLVMLKIVPPSGPLRYVPLSCAEDIHAGLLRPNLKTTYIINTSWKNLKLDVDPVNRVP